MKTAEQWAEELMPKVCNGVKHKRHTEMFERVIQEAKLEGARMMQRKCEECAHQTALRHVSGPIMDLCVADYAREIRELDPQTVVGEK